MPLRGVVKTRRTSAFDAAAQADLEDRYDVLLTSPPYGDSKTTVQYGGVSGICLDVVSRIHGLEGHYTTGNDIDRACLGGRRADSSLTDLRRYWAGAPGGESAFRISAFLEEFAQTSRALTSLLKPGGTMVMVVGRRSVGGFRVKLDAFLDDRMTALGMCTTTIEKRRIRQKRVPRTVNRFARSSCELTRDAGATKTMDEEIILSFQAPGVVQR